MRPIRLPILWNAMHSGAKEFAVSQTHPGIVLGRLQREGLVPYRNLRGLLVKVSPVLAEWISE